MGLYVNTVVSSLPRLRRARCIHIYPLIEKDHTVNSILPAVIWRFELVISGNNV